MYSTFSMITTASTLSTLVIPQRNPSRQYVTVHPVPKCRSSRKAIMVITGGAHCSIFSMIISVVEKTDQRLTETIVGLLWFNLAVYLFLMINYSIWHIYPFYDPFDDQLFAASSQ